MNHNGHPHLRDDLPYPQKNNVIALDCPRAHLHVEKCECGADTVRPEDPSIAAKVREEWGVSFVPDKRAWARVMAIAYDPAERDDVASAEVWPEGVPA